MTKLSKHLKYISSGVASTLALGSFAYAGPVKDLSQRVNCDSCCCEQIDLESKKPATIFQGGVDDGYQTGNSEPTNPRNALKSLPNIINYAVTHGRASTDATRDYDELQSNEYFLETINVTNAAIMKNGWLVFHLKKNGDGLDHNDAMFFGDFVSYQQESIDAAAVPRPVDKSRSRIFASNVSQFLSKTDHLGPVFKQDAATGAYYARLDRVKLVSADHTGTTNLLEQIKADGFMDMVVQDDTGVDYVAIIACIDQPREKPKDSDFKRIQRTK